MSTNLGTMARELEDAKEKVEKLSKKGGKASALKVDTATARLESASSQWESQAPFILETLQALDEQRCNHLRDVLTQLETHEVDQSDRLRASANDALATILEADTSMEIENFANKVTAGRARIERRTPAVTRQSTSTNVPTRQSTSTNNPPPSTADSSLAPPTSFSQMADNRSNHSLQDEKSGKSCGHVGTLIGSRLTRTQNRNYEAVSELSLVDGDKASTVDLVSFLRARKEVLSNELPAAMVDCHRKLLQAI